MSSSLDDGFFCWHEDIAPNVWQNPGETGADDRGRDRRTNGVDDDRNGFVDDVVGWDFVCEDPDPDHYVYDGKDRTRTQPYWHSISALGIIGAKGDNGIGVAGINWTVSLMRLKIGALLIGNASSLVPFLCPGAVGQAFSASRTRHQRGPQGRGRRPRAPAPAKGPGPRREFLYWTDDGDLAPNRPPRKRHRLP